MVFRQATRNKLIDEYKIQQLLDVILPKVLPIQIMEYKIESMPTYHGVATIKALRGNINTYARWLTTAQYKYLMEHELIVNTTPKRQMSEAGDYAFTEKAHQYLKPERKSDDNT